MRACRLIRQEEARRLRWSGGGVLLANLLRGFEYFSKQVRDGPASGIR